MALLNDAVMSPNASIYNEVVLHCSGGFFFDGNVTGICIPLCGEFNPKPQVAVIAEVVSVCVAIVAAVVLLILAFTIQRKSL